MSTATLSRSYTQSGMTISARWYCVYHSCRASNSLLLKPATAPAAPSLRPSGVVANNLSLTRPRLRRPGKPAFPILTTTRSISHTSFLRATTVLSNLRKDEDGNDMTIDITPRASKRLQQIMTQENNPSLLLRIHVTSGGCHGFQYLMSLTNTSSLSSEDDTVFQADDGTEAKIVLDEPSLELLKGSKVDFTTELIGSQFKITDNPKASSSCGCGTSFDIKE